MANDRSRILVIEDNKDVLEGILDLLEYCGYPAEGVTKFDEQVLEKLKKESFGLVICDIMLSGTDGRDLVATIRNTEETRDLPILMTSAYPDMEESVKEAGANGFLKKPFSLEELKQGVEEHLKE